MVERLKAEHNVDVEWRPFYLYIDTPPEGRELPEHVKQARAPGLGRAIAPDGGILRDGLRLYPADLQHAPGTRSDGIRPGARQRQRIPKVVFRKVYAEGQDPSQWDVLRSAAEEVGLDAEEMQREVENEKYMAQVVDQGPLGVPDRRDRCANLCDQ